MSDIYDLISKRVHLVGIGGSGMSSLARLYLGSGWSVSGSDRFEGDQVRSLQKLGVDMIPDHSPEIGSVGLVVHSSAVPRLHPQLVAARKSGIEVTNRALALTELIASRDVISVAGSHGKSTTATMLSVILNATGLAPGHMIGGISEALGEVNGRWGTGAFMVAETCEAFRGLDHWRPQHCLLTNVDDEHSEHYQNLAALQSGFADLISRVPDDGATILCGDDPFLSGLAARLGDRVLTYGTGSANRVRPGNQAMSAEGCTFDLLVDEVVLGHVTLPVTGRHNLRNALGALAMAVSLGIDPELACSALAGFRALHRRWQLVGEAHAVKIFDDFAHHPTEIEATLTMARSLAGSGRVHAVIEPQMISRVRRLSADFAAALALADTIWTLPLSPAGEVGDISAAEAVLEQALKNLPKPWQRIADPDAAAEALSGAARPGDVVVCMGPDLARKSANTIATNLAAIAALPDLRPGEDCAGFSGTQAPEALGPLLYDRFADYVASQPDAICAMTEAEQWTYSQMAAEAARIAAALAGRGIGPGDLVAVTMRKSLQYVAAVLGISIAGAAFVTIDPRMTRLGMGRALRVAGTRLTLSDDTHRSLEAGFDAPITLDTLLKECRGQVAPMGRPVTPDDLAYGIFTSGSTGMPRLVGVTHRNVVTYFDVTLGRIYAAEDYRLMPFTASISFDGGMHQLFCTLSLGGTLLVVDDLAGLSRSAFRDQVTLIGATPSSLMAFLETSPIPTSLRTINLGGEPTPPELLKRLRQTPGLSKVWNLYGPAETTMAVFAAPLLEVMATQSHHDNAGRVIGQPFEQVRTAVVDPEGAFVPTGHSGELLIGGPTVGCGYLGAPRLTAERFTVDPKVQGLRWYRTGDIVRQSDDGSFMFLGRLDDQVKINGARVELGEVRAALMTCPGVQNAAVLAHPGRDGRQRLAGFVVFEPGTDTGFLRTWLRNNHPPILTPHQIVGLSALPLQVNGKLDRQALLTIANEATQIPTVPADIEMTQAEAEVTAIWRRVMHREDIRAEDEFQVLGGDSLQAMEIIMATEAHFDVRFSAEALDRLSTPAAMALEMARQANRSSDMQRDLLETQRLYVSAWSGLKARKDALLRTLNPGNATCLFWVFQGDAEFASLSGALGPDVTLHGMRSGHLIMQYTPATIERLAEAYAAEISALQPEGPVAIGGNCQGATIARAIAFALRRLGRTVRKLVLMESARHWQYDAPVDLIYGNQSTLNPFLSRTDLPPEIATAYPEGFEKHTINGGHGAFFLPPNVPSLAAVLRDILLRTEPQYG